MVAYAAVIMCTWATTWVLLGGADLIHFISVQRPSLMFPFGKQITFASLVFFPLRGMVCVHFLGGLRAVQVDRLACAAALVTVRRALTWRWALLVLMVANDVMLARRYFGIENDSLVWTCMFSSCAYSDFLNWSKKNVGRNCFLIFLFCFVIFRRHAFICDIHLGPA